MAFNFIQPPPNSTGLKVDTAELTNGVNTVERQVVVVGDPTTAANVAGVTAGGAVKVDASATTQPVSISSAVTVQQATASNLKVDLSGTAANATAIKVDGSGVTQPVSIATPTSGGCSDFHLVSAGTTNANNIKASAGQIYTVSVFNNAAYPVFVKFHNTSGTPTAGVGVVHTLGAQAGTFVQWSNSQGFALGTGIGISIVKGIADADATAVIASDCVVDVQYK